MKRCLPAISKATNQNPDHFDLRQVKGRIHPGFGPRCLAASVMDSDVPFRAVPSMARFLQFYDRGYNEFSMALASRHQCLIYQGPPSRHLVAVASVMQQKLQQHHRCLYLNSPPMVAGMKSCVAARGVDVAGETANGSLVLSFDQNHLIGGREFDVDLMLETLKSGLRQALLDGYKGLWASGDMTWEFGPTRDFSKLLEYEWRLEEFLRENPEMSGICLYHADSMPHEVLHNGLLTHQSVFINETLSCINPHFLPAESIHLRPVGARLDSALHQLFEHSL